MFTLRQTLVVVIIACAAYHSGKYGAYKRYCLHNQMVVKAYESQLANLHSLLKPYTNVERNDKAWRQWN